MEFVVVDAFVSACIRCFGHGIEDVASHQAFEDFDDSFLCAYDGLVGDVLPFGFSLGFLPFRDCWFNVFGAFVFLFGCCCGCQSIFLGLVDHAVCTDHLVGCDLVYLVVGAVKKLDHSQTQVVV